MYGVGSNYKLDNLVMTVIFQPIKFIVCKKLVEYYFDAKFNFKCVFFFFCKTIFKDNIFKFWHCVSILFITRKLRILVQILI